MTIGALSTTTDSQGSYSFLAVPPGLITVTLVPPAGWSPVDPSSGTRSLTVAASQSYTGEDFVAGPIVTVTGAARTGMGRNTTIDLGFSGPLDSVDASDPANYRLTLIGRPAFPGESVTVSIPIRKAVYNAATGTVTLKTRYPFALTRRIEVEVIGSGISSAAGVLLDGSGDGRPGSNFMAQLAPRFDRPVSARDSVVSIESKRR